MIIRQEIRSLDSAQLENLRSAFSELQQKQGPDGYQHIAGFHGVPRGLCPHRSSLFLPWHRAYVLEMERALRQIDSNAHLPFWDWTSDRSIAEGIPEAYSVGNYQLADGTLAPNPLHSALADSQGRATFRDHRPPALLRGYADQVRMAMDKPTFMEFTASLEGPHGSLHTWVRGDMGSASYAAYDPIFWAHHANVDRQWAIWQRQHSDGNPPPEVLQRRLDPFGISVADVIDHQSDLDYDYEGLDLIAPIPILRADDRGLFRLEEFGHPRPRIVMRVHEKMSEESFNIDIFINQPDADISASIIGNPHFAGSFGLFGMGEGSSHHGGHGPHHLHNVEENFTTQRVIDITDAVERVGGDGTPILIKMIASTLDGRMIEIDRVPIGGISIEIA